ncbi:MBL fold metallo-hydrolase, partial [Paratractidigestivibacter sp.]|uniref:MBL fold metallo-hydrolase n=1 Tax=Paratractidigestivibacter sp. TaxID=2847316 RepID=UPI0040293EAC
MGESEAASGRGRDELRCFVVGPIQTNCFAYVSGGACMVVDPGDSGAAVAEQLTDVRVDYIVATHGHGDHVGGVLRLKEACGAPFLINEAAILTSLRKLADRIPPA